jgi:cell division protein FtsB
VLLAVLAAVAYLDREDIANYFANYDKRNRLRDEKDRLDGDIRGLEREREVLAKGGFDLEVVARERFRMSKPGENVLYVEPPADETTTQTQRKK